MIRGLFKGLYHSCRSLPLREGRFGQHQCACPITTVAFTASLPASESQVTEPKCNRISKKRLNRYNESVRWNWQVVLKRVLDRKTGKYKYEDWDKVMYSIEEPTLASTGQSLLQHHLKETRHIKPTEVRKRLNEKKAYRRKDQKVEDLMSYIQFMSDNREEEDLPKTNKKK